MFNGSILLPVNFVFFIPSNETLLVFVKFSLYQALLRCIALPCQSWVIFTKVYWIDFWKMITRETLIWYSSSVGYFGLSVSQLPLTWYF